MDIRCFQCSKLFATATGQRVFVAASTSIEFEEDVLQIEIKCPRCKRMTSISLSSGIE
jgi:phage FluMu protein Com